VVFQSEGNKDHDIEKFNEMVLPKDPFGDQKKCIRADDSIRAHLEQKIGQASAANREDLEAELDNVIKACMSKATTTILSDCIPKGLIKRFPKNNISTMCLTGAKGGLVN
jgi:DNA-directed RNA polymerase I subunit RPA1